jgi:hypothetical protein
MRYLYLLFIPALMLAGCNSPSDSNVAGDAVKRQCMSTPGKTLEQLTRVWNENNEIDDYRALLTQDYHFNFNTAPMPQPPPYHGLPQSWDFMEDISATENMFAQAYDIQLIVQNADDFDDPNIFGDFYQADNVLIQFNIWPENGDFYYTATGPCDFGFIKIGEDWLISAWYDRTGGIYSEHSLGELRFMYE